MFTTRIFLRSSITAWWALWLATPAMCNDESTLTVSYQREIAPLLARYCYECHGPDAEQRASDLRLDVRTSAFGKLESGKTAVVAGAKAQSEVVRRLFAKDDDRMPPIHSTRQPSEAERGKIVKWIEQGAKWQSHWAFEPLQRPKLPKIRQTAWPNVPLDYFVIDAIEQRGLVPAAPTSAANWLRRVHFDLLGVPPTAEELASFLKSPTQERRAQVVDRLLSSPLYGQRWGRHWLDVVRYGDSNGSDENHAYPNAYHYRNYVIDAFNKGTAFDQFVRQQIAGDLLPDNTDDQFTVATGFLAIGSKILAERDPVKKQADMIDEQMDTLGRTFFGLTIGCARCHDHKFDPISHHDYYALAGVFHSTSVGDRKTMDRSFKKRKAEFDRTTARQRADLAILEKEVTEATKNGAAILREAEAFSRGNVSKITDGYGEGIGIISDPGSQTNFAEYDINVKAGGKYLLQIRFAAKTSRPGILQVDGKKILDILSQTTGGWYPQHQKWISAGMVELPEGNRVIRFQSKPMMSHIDKWRLVSLRANEDLADKLERIDKLQAELATLQKSAPQPRQVMGSSDVMPKNVHIHLRGSHLSLGEKVDRGFLAALQSTRAPKIPEESSGRLQLASWMTSPNTTAGQLAARTIVNRIWHWHFGKGLVPTTDNLGRNGSPPSNTRLLEHLSSRLIELNWSLKDLQREILLSQTYGMSSQANHDQNKKLDPTNQWLWKRDQKRLDAEAIRDSLLQHAGRLDVSLGGAPLTLKAQDPSPQDAAKHREFFRTYRRRSVYLPVIRSHLFRFMTLYDFPNATTPVGRRDTTTVATQALLMMNSEFVMEQSEALAARLIQQRKTDIARIQLAHQMLFTRNAKPTELEAALSFLAEFGNTLPADASKNVREIKAWAALCQTWFASNEYVYVR